MKHQREDSPIVEFWQVFDIVYLSCNKSEVVRKLLVQIRARNQQRVSEKYKEVVREVETEGEFGEIIGQLIAEGEFEHISTIVKKNRYYRS